MNDVSEIIYKYRFPYEARAITLYSSEECRKSRYVLIFSYNSPSECGMCTCPEATKIATLAKVKEVVAFSPLPSNVITAAFVYDEAWNAHLRRGQYSRLGVIGLAADRCANVGNDFSYALDRLWEV